MAELGGPQANGTGNWRRSARTALDKIERGFSKYEKSIGALTAGATAVGLIFAGISSFATWRQLEIIARERTTPYKAILYTSKLESYKAVFAEFRRFDDDLLVPMVEGSAALKVDWGSDPEAEEIFVQRSTEAFNSFEKMRTLVEANRVVWREPVSAKMDQMVEGASSLMRCFFAGRVWSRSLPPEQTDNLRKQLGKDCPVEVILKRQKMFRERANDLLLAMRQDLKADQFQEISSE